MTREQSLSRFDVRQGIQGSGVFAGEDFPANTVLFTLQGVVLNTPTRTSVQVGEHAHIEDRLGAYLNHACHPTAKIDWATRSVISLTVIGKGEEVTFDYRDNETHLAVPFVCRCCSKKITGKILHKTG